MAIKGTDITRRGALKLAAGTTAGLGTTGLGTTGLGMPWLGSALAQGTTLRAGIAGFNVINTLDPGKATLIPEYYVIWSIYNGLLTFDEARSAFGTIMSGEATPSQIGAFLMALRVRGELRAKQEARAALAEADFRDAIALAQKMGAKLSELRATMSLARLLVSQGRRDEARTMLAEIYNWFTEGFDTTLDLIDAKALLDELSN